MTDAYQEVKDLTEKAAKASSSLEALQYSQAAFNAANAIARTQEMGGKPGEGGAGT